MKLSDPHIMAVEPVTIQNGRDQPPLPEGISLIVAKAALDYEILITEDELREMLAECEARNPAAHAAAISTPTGIKIVLPSRDLQTRLATCLRQTIARLAATPINAARGMLPMCEGDFKGWQAVLDEASAPTRPATMPRIYTKCPACGNDTLTINDDKHLLCTWVDCPDPTLIDRGRPPTLAPQPREAMRMGAGNLTPAELAPSTKTPITDEATSDCICGAHATRDVVDRPTALRLEEDLAAAYDRGRSHELTEGQWLEKQKELETWQRRFGRQDLQETIEETYARWNAETFHDGVSWQIIAGVLKTRAAELETEIRAVLGTIPGNVRVCEGGGPENLGASLAVSVSVLINRIEKLKEELEAVRLCFTDASHSSSATLTHVEGLKKELEVARATDPWTMLDAIRGSLDKDSHRGISQHELYWALSKTMNLRPRGTA